MKIAAAVVLIALLIVNALVEERACECGSGLFRAELPNGLRADWFNGTFWLTDAEGWGVIAPPTDLRIGDAEELAVRRVRRYLLGHEMIVDVELESGAAAFVAIESTSDSIQLSQVTSEYLRRRAGADVDALRWIDVLPRNCFFGLIWVIRVLLVTGIVAALLFATRLWSTE